MYKKYCLLLSVIAIQSCTGALQKNTFITFIAGFNLPVNIAITPNNTLGYVADQGSNSVLVIDTNPASSTFNTLIAAPNLNGVFNSPNCIAITPNNNFAYVTDYGSNSVLVIDTNPSSPTFNSLITAPNLVGVFNSPNGIAITPDGQRAYVSNAGNNNVNVIDINPASPSYNSVLVTPGLDGVLNSPFSMAITPDGNYAYVCNLTGTVSVLDTNPSSPTYNTLIAAPAVNPQPEGLGITANGFFTYVCDGSGSAVTVLDTNPASPTFNTVISAPNLASAFNAPNGVATIANGDYAYVTNFLGESGSISSVSVIDTNPSSPTYNSTISTPGLSLPFLTRFLALSATPNGAFVYALDGYNNNIGVIYTGVTGTPLSLTGCKLVNRFLLQMDRINRLTWSAPTIGLAPASYKIYRDAGLTQLVATIPATAKLQYDDNNRPPFGNNTYYIVSMDILGNVSAPASTIVTTYCA